MMREVRRMLMMTALLVSLGLVATACGSDEDAAEPVPTSTPAAESTPDQDAGELPVVGDDEVTDAPVVGAMCVPDEPNCEDTLVGDPPVSDLPEPTDADAEVTSGDVGMSGMTVEGGLTISDALATDATGILAVTGHLFDDGTGPQLCENLIGLGERYGCDGEHISITNYDSVAAGDDVIIHDGITYTEDLLTLFGELVNGSLVVDGLVAG